MAHESDDGTGGVNEPPKYVNYLQVGHNAVEFLFAFGEQRRDETYPRIYQTLITNPIYAKAFLVLLESSVRKYEAEFGPLPEE